MSYHVPAGGLPPQTALTTDRAVFTEAYAVIPGRTLSDITASFLPGWERTRLWVLARPLSGFAETFSQYVVEVAPGGGADHPEPDPRAEGVLFVVGGSVELTVEGDRHRLDPGGYAYLPPSSSWAVRNAAGATATFHWIRKAYQPADGLGTPPAFVTRERDVTPVEMPGTDGAWSTTRFVDVADLRHERGRSLHALMESYRCSPEACHAEAGAAVPPDVTQAVLSTPGAEAVRSLGDA